MQKQILVLLFLLLLREECDVGHITQACLVCLRVLVQVPSSRFAGVLCYFGFVRSSLQSCCISQEAVASAGKKKSLTHWRGKHSLQSKFSLGFSVASNKNSTRIYLSYTWEHFTVNPWLVVMTSSQQLSVSQNSGCLTNLITPQCGPADVCAIK